MKRSQFCRYAPFGLFCFLFGYFVSTLLNHDHRETKECGLDYNRKRWRSISEEHVKSMSALGRILYLDEAPADVTSENYAIFWKGANLNDGCSVANCKLTEDEEKADLVVFDLDFITELPTRKNRQQIWVWQVRDSPQVFQKYWQKFNGVFNWSMTYRFDSDIPAPLGRTVALKPWQRGEGDDATLWNRSKKQDVLVAFVSTAGNFNNRWEFITAMEKIITIDRCDPPSLTCISQYKFFLAFENSNCEDYITLAWQALKAKSIPIIMGPPKASCQRLLPPNSYLYAVDYARPMDLANYLAFLNETLHELSQFLSWTRYFKVVDEDPVCRTCEALNYNDKSEKVYADLKQFWNESRDCFPNWNKLSN